MRKIFTKFIDLYLGLHTLFWCFFHKTKFKKGFRVGYHVKKKWHVTLIVSKNVRIGSHTLLWGNGTITIGLNSSIGPYSNLYSCSSGGIVFGDYVNSASHLYMIDSDHGTSRDSLMMTQEMISKPIFVGNDVWFGYHVTVLKGVTIANGSVLGACSVVTKDTKEYFIYGGVPAVPIGERK